MFQSLYRIVSCLNSHWVSKKRNQDMEEKNYIKPSILFSFSVSDNFKKMAPHPIPQEHPIPTPQVQERFKRRLQTPQAMAPPPRARQIQVLSWAVSICK